MGSTLPRTSCVILRAGHELMFYSLLFHSEVQVSLLVGNCKNLYSIYMTSMNTCIVLGSVRVALKKNPLKSAHALLTSYGALNYTKITT